MTVKQHQVMVLTENSVWLGPRNPRRHDGSSLQQRADSLPTKSGHDVGVSKRPGRPPVSRQRHSDVQPLS